MLKRLLSAVCAVWAATAAFGQALNYAQSTVEVRAGVLLVESQRNAGAPTNRSPHIWANLDKDKTVKPAKWTFTNPLGQTSATLAMINRWSGRPGGAPALGARLAKSAAGYWEVPLAETDDRTLARFDVLTLTVNGLISLNSENIGRVGRVLQGEQKVDELLREMRLRPVVKFSVKYAF